MIAVHYHFKRSAEPAVGAGSIIDFLEDIIEAEEVLNYNHTLPFFRVGNTYLRWENISHVLIEEDV